MLILKPEENSHSNGIAHCVPGSRSGRMRHMDLGLDGRVYLVTGGSRGLGYATASVLVSEGARVVLASRDEASVTEAAQKLGSDVAVGLAEDLGKPGTAERLVAAANARFGQLDGALISVGGLAAGTAMDTTDDTLRTDFG